MEFIIVLILWFFGWAIFKAVVSAGAKTIGAAGKAAVGNGSFSENMNLAFKGMQEFEIRIVESTLNDDGTGPLVKELEGKGLFPLNATTNVGFVTSIFDKTSGEFEPVLSVIDAFQENGNIAFQHHMSVGEITPNQGFVRWVRLGVIIPEILEPPYSGIRNMVAVIRMVDLDNPPEIHHGFGPQGGNGILWQKTLTFDWEFEEKGYREASEHRDEAIGLSLEIGMAVAMADGSLDDEEGKVLRDWIIKSIEPYSGERKVALKELYNSSMRDAYSDALNGNLNLSRLTERMNEIADKTTKYETIELCFEVMAADGVADESEITLIKQVAASLDLDMDEVSKLRDHKLINLNSEVSDHASIEILLGIDPSWSHEQIMRHLRIEFQKWNNRLNTLDEGEERDNAQLMLNRIAEARKRYAS